MRWIAAFGRFWYDFIVGDSIVLAIGGPAAIVVGYLLLESGASAIDQVALPLVVIVTLLASLAWRSR